jgi:hypothetical protein
MACIGSPGEIFCQRATHTYQSVCPGFLPETIFQIDFDGSFIILLHFQENAFQIASLPTEPQEFGAGEADVAPAPSLRRHQKPANLRATVRPVDPLNRRLPNRPALHLHNENEIVFQGQISAIPGAVLLRRNELGILEPNADVIAIPPSHGHIQVGFRDQPQLDIGVSERLDGLFHFA